MENNTHRVHFFYLFVFIKDQEKNNKVKSKKWLPIERKSSHVLSPFLFYIFTLWATWLWILTRNLSKSLNFPSFNNWFINQVNLNGIMIPPFCLLPPNPPKKSMCLANCKISTGRYRNDKWTLNRISMKTTKRGAFNLLNLSNFMLRILPFCLDQRLKGWLYKRNLLRLEWDGNSKEYSLSNFRKRIKA